MKFPGNELVALLVAISFAAGLNLYATVATLGLLAHAGVLGSCSSAITGGRIVPDDVLRRNVKMR